MNMTDSFFRIFALLLILVPFATSHAADSDDSTVPDPYQEPSAADLGYYDPFEKFNRKIFNFSYDFLLPKVIEPTVRVYDKIVPDPVEKGISNFFSNLGEPNTIFNDVMQMKYRQAGSDSLRFFINTTVGIFGIFDVATRLGFEKHNEDLGQTLGVWGIPNGPFLMAPFPTTLRHAGATPPVSTATGLDLSLVNFIDNDRTRNSLIVLNLVNGLKAVVSFASMADSFGDDRYALARSAILQRIEFDTNDGVVEDNFLNAEDEDLYEDL